MKIILVGAGLLIISTLMLVPMAHASASTTVTGTVVLTSFTITNMRFAAGNVIISGTETGIDFGDISGTFVGTAILVVVHADGSSDFQGSGTETASVLGSPVGTFSWSESGTTTADGLDNGRFVITQGTGGLAGIHGVIGFSTPFVGAPYDVYSGQVHFESA